MIRIPKTIIDQMFLQAEKEAPVEACGYLAGQENEVMTHYPMTNIDKSSDHFSLDPAEQFKVVKSARENGYNLLAVYHSHPMTPARPSAEDIKLAYDPNILYVIVSLADDEKDIQAFSITNQKVTKEKVEII